VVVKRINVRVSEDTYNDIHKVMGYTLVSSDGDLTIERMHRTEDSNESFYRRVLEKGIAMLKKEWDEKVEKYESQDRDRR